ncbi:MerR family transcriptional regulator [Paenibacillus rigui]|uniref:HTH merR-type domain-containing protein n=1 Tax=Paenibacillus rigui TaxID=554312 RepID=A0A229UGI0_9BACL|nr:MerR family transcriptional regulator [Paenibacillus rigui]OXM82504.1 hypothetical protein CF651_30660 [Paenibacillus rigui]
MNNEKTYSMSELIALLRRNKGQIRYVIDTFRDFVEIHGEQHRTRYSQKTFELLGKVLKMKDRGMSINEIRATFDKTNEAEHVPSESILEAFLKNPKISITVDVNIRFVR